MASKKKYRLLTSDWLRNRDLPARDATADLKISELVLAFWKHAKKYYRQPDGSPWNVLQIDAQDATVGAEGTERCAEVTGVERPHPDS